MKEEMYDTAGEQERVILVAVCTHSEELTEQSLVELKELTQTAGACTVATLTQNREKIHAATYIGKGKIEELIELIENYQADSVICDDELSPAQLGNLSDALGCPVIDRTILILDIFAQRASTSEGKLQVELAQLRYRASRLVGLRSALSRQGGKASGGGYIGTRGPGEKKLEMDRRLIKERISFLQKELDGVKKAREVARKKRMGEGVPVVAIVGYTNAGKSTLLNKLTDAGVLEEDQLFATLDPTTRQLELESGQSVLFTDTVGFIRKLPHHLIQAFRSTLEEAKYADIILHVVDASNPDMDAQMETVYETLEQLGVKDKPIITAFNKVDKIPEETVLKDMMADKSLRIAAKMELNLDGLLGTVEQVLRESKVEIEHIFSYQKAGDIQMIRKYGQLLEEDYRGEGIYVHAFIPREIAGKLGLS